MRATQIFNEKPQFKATASPKIGSLDNAEHKAAGGNVKIHNEKLEFSAAAQSKVGSLPQNSGVAGAKDPLSAEQASK